MKKLDLVYSDHVYCFECGEPRMTRECFLHAIAKFRFLIYPESHISPLFYSYTNSLVCYQQATVDPRCETTGTQYTVNLPKNYIPMVRYIVDHSTGLVSNGAYEPIGYSQEYIFALLAGDDYIPRREVGTIVEE